MRGIAAVVVCASHLRSGLFIDYNEYVTAFSSDIFHKTFYFITGLGHQAVMIFFVLSGFFVGGSILKNIDEFGLKKYFIARLSRLWTVLIPALFLTAIVDFIVATYHPEILNGNSSLVINSLPQSGSYSPFISTFLGNVFFLQGVLTPVFGINGPLWSLANEFWYYILFPILLMVAMGKKMKIGLKVRGILMAVALVISLILPLPMLLYFFIWLLGVAVFVLSKSIACHRKQYVILSAVVLFTMCLVYSKSESMQNYMLINGDALVAISTSILCFTLANPVVATGSGWFQKIVGKIAAHLSDFSYSLYLTHFPLIVLLIAFGGGLNRLTPNFTGMAAYLSFLLGLVVVGIIFWYFFERHTNRVRIFLNRVFLSGKCEPTKNSEVNLESEKDFR